MTLNKTFSSSDPAELALIQAATSQFAYARALYTALGLQGSGLRYALGRMAVTSPTIQHTVYGRNMGPFAFAGGNVFIHAQGLTAQRDPLGELQTPITERLTPNGFVPGQPDAFTQRLVPNNRRYAGKPAAPGASGLEALYRRDTYSSDPRYRNATLDLGAEVDTLVARGGDFSTACTPLCMFPSGLRMALHVPSAAAPLASNVTRTAFPVYLLIKGDARIVTSFGVLEARNNHLAYLPPGSNCIILPSGDTPCPIISTWIDPQMKTPPASAAAVARGSMQPSDGARLLPSIPYCEPPDMKRSVYYQRRDGRFDRYPDVDTPFDLWGYSANRASFPWVMDLGTATAAAMRSVRDHLAPAQWEVVANVFAALPKPGTSGETGYHLTEANGPVFWNQALPLKEKVVPVDKVKAARAEFLFYVNQLSDAQRQLFNVQAANTTPGTPYCHTNGPVEAGIPHGAWGARTGFTMHIHPMPHSHELGQYKEALARLKVFAAAQNIVLSDPPTHSSSVDAAPTHSSSQSDKSRSSSSADASSKERRKRDRSPARNDDDELSASASTTREDVDGATQKRQDLRRRSPDGKQKGTK